MKNFEVINLVQTIDMVQAQTTPDEIKEFSYCFIKNKFRAKDVISELSDLYIHFEKINPIKEEETKNDYAARIHQILYDSEEYKTFAEEEAVFEIYTFNIDKLQGTGFNLKVANTLLPLGIFVE